MNAVGGHDSRAALPLCLGISMFAIICAFPVPFLDNVRIIVLFMWWLLFFGGMSLPLMT